MSSGILTKEYAVSYFSKTNIKMLKSHKTIFSERGFPVSQNVVCTDLWITTRPMFTFNHDQGLDSASIRLRFCTIHPHQFLGDCGNPFWRYQTLAPMLTDLSNVVLCSSSLISK